MFKAIIFDFDGTLADSSEVMMLALRRMAGRYDYPVLGRKELEELKILPIKDRFKKMGLPIYKIPLLIREIKKTFVEEQDSLRPFPGVREMLLFLAERGFELYVLSTNTREVIGNFLKTNDMDVFVSINSSPGLFGKHRTMLKLLQKQGLSKEDVLYVGDELRDIEACKSAGIKVLAVTWGFDSPTMLENGNPNYIAHTPEEILEIADGQP
ncbi:MAG: HAD-IA family hydrolase [Bacillota bacterium]|nr:HAD-IA family hydrolase [Bacillota bacterium]